MKHTNLREEILQSMEYSKQYTKKQKKVDVITYILLGFAVLLLVATIIF